MKENPQRFFNDMAIDANISHDSLAKLSGSTGLLDCDKTVKCP